MKQKQGTFSPEVTEMLSFYRSIAQRSQISRRAKVDSGTCAKTYLRSLWNIALRKRQTKSPADS
jgi:hypothetical protein